MDFFLPSNTQGIHVVESVKRNREKGREIERGEMVLCGKMLKKKEEIHKGRRGLKQQ